jgi:pilus assembly protein CpaE
MSGKPPSPQDSGKSEITILLVDDIPETRENIKKLLAFEPDFKVIGTASTGREGVDQAKEAQPDIIIMDINMPDMDGLQATNIINKQVPTAAVIIMSVQNDSDYMRRAMLAGARDFLTKPINMDELYNTIRTVYKNHEPIRRQYAAMETMPQERARVAAQEEGSRAGHVIAVYSPQGGAGVTTIAVSLASGLMKEGIKVLLVDADLQFADIASFLNIQAQTTIVELAQDVDDLDVDLFENIVVTHESGLKVLVGPGRPELADEVKANPATVGMILEKVRINYDFVVVDTATALDETLLGIFDQATRIALVVQPTLISVKNVRFVLELFDQLGYNPEKATLVLNRVWDERKGKSATIAPERIENFLKRPVIGKIPSVDERILLSAINRGVPIIAADRDQNKPPIRQLLDLSESIYTSLMGAEGSEGEDADEKDKQGSRFGIFGR